MKVSDQSEKSWLFTPQSSVNFCTGKFQNLFRSYRTILMQFIEKLCFLIAPKEFKHAGVALNNALSIICIRRT